MPLEENTPSEIIPEVIPETPTTAPTPTAEPTPVEEATTTPAEIIPEPSEPTPATIPAVTPIETTSTSQPEPIPTPPPLPSQPEQSPVTQPSTPTLHTKLSSLLATARNLIQTRRNQKLEKIITFALNQKAKGKLVANDDVEKLPHVSDATATRYLSTLVKQGRLKRSGEKKGAIYEIQG